MLELCNHISAYIFCNSSTSKKPLLLLIPPNRQEGGGGGGEVLVRAQEQPARGGPKLWRLPRLPDVPSGTQAPPPQFNCRPRHRRRQQQLNPLGSTPPSSSIPQSPRHLVRHPARAFSALLHLQGGGGACCGGGGTGHRRQRRPQRRGDTARGGLQR
jgi:hypothetical protein